MLLHTGINVYMIVTLETIVTRNRVGDEEREWTFGQALDVFVDGRGGGGGKYCLAKDS